MILCPSYKHRGIYQALFIIINSQSHQKESQNTSTSQGIASKKQRTNDKSNTQKKFDKSAKHNQIYQTSNKIKNVFRIYFVHTHTHTHHRDPLQVKEEGNKKNVQSANEIT